MTQKPCSRVWQAEAVLDAVLSRADAASFERHGATCTECAAERAALVRLGNVARRLPSLEVSPLRRRALHNELLRRANELSTGVAPARFRALRVIVPAVACVLTVLCFLWFRWPGRPLASNVAPSYHLTASANARWHVAMPGRALRLALESGSLTVAVKKLEPSQRFFVALPDGELEVRGTRFTVACDAAHTQSVSVTDGRVALRLNGRAPLSLGAGEAWSSEPAQRATSPAPPPDPAASPLPGTSAQRPQVTPLLNPAPLGSMRHAPTQPAAKSEPSASRVQGRTRSAPASAEKEVGPRDVATAQPTAAREFADAMAAFSRGDFGMAERLFDEFAERYPRSPHVEDMLFLKALGRSRRGDTSGARSFALEYLRRFPGGFRSVEAQRLAAPRPGLAANPGLVNFP